jgi:hypothetical protein
MNSFHHYVSSLRSISKCVTSIKIGSTNQVGILWAFANDTSLEKVHNTIGAFNIMPVKNKLFIYKSIK